MPLTRAGETPRGSEWHRIFGLSGCRVFGLGQTNSQQGISHACPSLLEPRRFNRTSPKSEIPKNRCRPGHPVRKNLPARAPPRQGVGLHPGGASRPRRAACKGGPRLSGPWQVKKGHSFSTGFTGLTGFVDENRSVSRNPAQNSLCLSEQDSLRSLCSLWLKMFQYQNLREPCELCVRLFSSGRH